jgi:enamine deaminase RidA (YjgF/YER057c/UK114 family)
MKRHVLLASLAALSFGAAANAEPAVKFIYANPTAFIAQGAVVPAGSEIFFVSGIPGSAAAGDTAAQTTDSLTKLGAVLKAQGYDFSDVVNVKVYLVGDPAMGGKMDFAGMNASFKKVFGPATEPNRPSRVTVQVAGLAAPGSLVEIELTAAKAPK